MVASLPGAVPQAIAFRALGAAKRRGRLELDPLLRPDPRLEWMLHLSHLGNEIGGGD